LANVTGTIPSGANVLKVTVDTVVNDAMASATICAPGSTSNCITIDHLTVDTGSVGVRLNASALSGLALPGVVNAGGYQAAECQTFTASSVWGAIRLADVSLGSETAHNLPIQVVSDTGIPSAPADCSSIAKLPGNGTIGIGYNPQDCGVTCATTSAQYYACPAGSGTCGHAKLAISSQVSNPIAFFPTDNNGVIFELPAIPAGGASTVTGAIVFGIGTQSNNSPTSLTAVPVSSVGTLTATLNGVAYQQSIVDSGTSYITFNDSSIPSCSNGLYCPSSSVTLSATLQGMGGSAIPVSFNVVNASTQAFGYASNVARSTTSTNQVIFGLPFFYGKTVVFALAGTNTSLGAGPFVAM
jgi:hypothetical protein